MAPAASTYGQVLPRQAAGQPSKAEATDPNTNVVNPPSDPNLVSISPNGLPGICVGDHITLAAIGGNGTYTWSPNVGLSATTGATVVAGPLVNTTYTVTNTNPSTGAPTTATVNVAVRENCCPTAHIAAYIVNLPGSFFDAGTGSPFTGYPAGTRFHFSGSSPIILSGLAFQPPVGSVILMDSGKDLYLQDGASLSLSGVSITAACNDMWGKLWVRNSAAGISSTFTDGATGEVRENGTNTPAGLTSLRNQFSHSLGGLDFEQPSSAANVPYCHLTATDFLHNEQSIVMHRDNYGQNVYGGITYSYVSYSAFDSNPAYFKAPKAYAVGTPDYPHYSQYHVLFGGHAGILYRSSMRHALFGFHNPDDGQAATLRVLNDQFSDCYLAGVNVNATANGASGVETVYVTGSTFNFPTLLSLPTTPQFTNAINTDVLDQVGETRGIFMNNPIVVIETSSFTQANDPYASFAFTERYKQVGTKAKRILGYNNNTCTLLHTGVEMSDILTAGPAVSGNVFTACRRGLELHGGGVAYRGGEALTPATVNLPLTCNTFDRADAARPGTAYGIYLEMPSRVSFDPLDPAVPVPILKNKFFDYMVGLSGFYAIYNGSSVLPLYVKYTTYTNYIQRPTPASPPVLQNHSDLGAICDGITLRSGGNYQPGQACGTGNPGLERASQPQSGLEPNSPNPATGQTTLHYHLASATGTAALNIRRSTDGQLMRQMALKLGSTAAQLDLHGWPSGVYVVTLYVDAVPLKSSKLIVQ